MTEQQLIDYEARHDEAPEEIVEIRAESAEMERKKALQKAVLLLCKDLDISIVSESSHDAVLNFHGKMSIDYDVIGDLLEAELIHIGYRTGRIRPGSGKSPHFDRS